MFLLLGLACTPVISGCGGCRDDEEAAKAKAKAKPKKPKPDFSRFRLRVLPNDGRPLSRSVKPGHWTAGTLRAKANNFTFVGRLDASVVDMEGRSLEVERTPFYLASSRPARLTKGDIRYMELFFFVPRGSERSRLDCRLRDRHSGAEIRQENEPLVHMPAHQYYLFVMARQPERYRNLTGLTSIRAPVDAFVAENEDLHYRVLRPRIRTQQIPLPSQSLAWTSIAYLLWDGIGPEELRADQRQAMLDWLHWGGQLIVSGPDTLDLLQNSFLKPYLPATTTKTAKISAPQLADLSRYWSIAGANSIVKPLAALKPWVGIGLEKHPDAAYLPGADGLVVERSVGRGRIVVTAFRLNQAELLNWPSFDSFFSGGVLRREPRSFIASQGGGEDMVWVGYPDDRFDARKTTNLRYFSRDARETGYVVTSHGRMTQLDDGVSDESDRYVNAKLKIVSGPGTGQSRTITQYGSDRQTHHDDWKDLPDTRSVYVIDVGGESGVAGWNDFSATSAAIRSALKDASGIAIPKREFVLRVLGVYLLVIVPLNWFLFWVIGRVEWAWIAAPVIAVLCAITVIWLAQLDIGFARSKTEIATIEAHAGYPRAHVTRCATLYTSLSTRYNLEFDDLSAIAQPFSSGASFAEVSRQSRATIEYRRDADVRLANFEVPSNSTGMLRCEYMWDLGGTLALETAGRQLQVRNSTRVPLEAVAVVRKLPPSGTTSATSDRRQAPVIEAAWVGRLAAGAAQPLRFAPVSGRIRFAGWEQAPATASRAAKGSLSVRHLMEMAVSPAEMAEGDTRLIGWVDQDLPGMRVEPAASQTRRAAVVVAHLEEGARPIARPDANISTLPVETLKEDEDEFLDDEDDQEQSEEERAADAEEAAQKAGR